MIIGVYKNNLTPKSIALKLVTENDYKIAHFLEIRSPVIPVFYFTVCGRAVVPDFIVEQVPADRQLFTHNSCSSWMLHSALSSKFFPQLSRSWRGMSAIRPQLFLGSANDAMDGEQLTASGITHILSLLTEPLPALDKHGTVKFVDIMDCDEADLLEVLEDCLQYMKAAIDGGGKVLVHW